MNDKTIILLAVVAAAWFLLSGDGKTRRAPIETPPPPPLPPAQNPDRLDPCANLKTSTERQNCRAKRAGAAICGDLGAVFTAGIVGAGECASAIDAVAGLGNKFVRTPTGKKVGEGVTAIVEAPGRIVKDPVAGAKMVANAPVNLAKNILGLGGRDHRLQDSELKKLRDRCGFRGPINQLALDGYPIPKSENVRDWPARLPGAAKDRKDNCYRTAIDLRRQCEGGNLKSRRDLQFCQSTYGIKWSAAV